MQASAQRAIAHRLNDNTAQNLTFLINAQPRQHKLSCIYAIAAAIWRQESAQRLQCGHYYVFRTR
ncbi:hypothetical protein HW132_23630 [Brasilonema sp. CT11]|nr:hypothetical protein [Brasilonema sp. CT11]